MLDKKQIETPVKIGEISNLLGLSKVTLHSYKKKGLIPYHRLGRNVYFYPSEVLDSLQKIEVVS